MNKEIYKCSICGEQFTGENARLFAERCEAQHTEIFISVWDFELPGVVNGILNRKYDLVPRSFIKKLRKLRSRVLRG